MQRLGTTISKRGVMLALGLGLVVLWSSGCKSAVDFNYSPLAAVDTLCMGNDCSRLVCVRFVDERETQKVGGVKNLYGMTISGFVFDQEDLTVQFTAAVTDTLRKAGYQVAMNSERVTGEQIPAGELQGMDYVVGGRILAISVNTKPGWSNVNASASVEIHLWLQKVGGAAQGEWIGPIAGESLKQSYASISDTSEAAERALNMAMQDCMMKLVRHLKASGALAGG